MLFGKIPISVSYSPTITGNPLKLSQSELPVSHKATPEIFLFSFSTVSVYTRLDGALRAVRRDIRLTVAKQTTVDTASTDRSISKYTVPLLYIIPTGATVTQSTSIIPPKAKPTEKKVKKQRKNLLALRNPKETNTINALAAIRTGSSK